MKITTLYEYWTKILNKPLPKWQDRKPIYEFFLLNKMQPLDIYSNYTGTIKQNNALLKFLLDENNKDAVNNYFNPKNESSSLQSENKNITSGNKLLYVIIGIIFISIILKKKK